MSSYAIHTISEWKLLSCECGLAWLGSSCLCFMPLKEHVSGGVAPSDSVVEKSVSPSCHRSVNGMSVVGSHGDLGGGGDCSTTLAN